MRLGLQQPYFFPHLPYYQLVLNVDRFVAYDDVAWIKGGWINRNRLLVRDRPGYVGIPTKGASPNVSIDSVAIAEGRWRDKVMRTVDQCYARAPFKSEVLALLDAVVSTPTALVADLAVASLVAVRDYLGYATPIERSHRRYPPTTARGQERVIAICLAEGATEYVNTIGGRDLYDPEAFRTQGIDLRFLCPRLDGTRHATDLSILHTLMYHSRDEVKELMSAFELL